MRQKLTQRYKIFTDSGPAGNGFVGMGVSERSF